MLVERGIACGQWQPSNRPKPRPVTRVDSSKSSNSSRQWLNLFFSSDSAIESRRKKTSRCRCADRWSCFRSGAREKQTRTNEQTGELWAFIDPLPQDQFKINSSRFKSHRLLQVASTWLPFRSKLDKVTQSANCIKLHPIKSNVEMNV